MKKGNAKDDKIVNSSFINKLIMNHDNTNDTALFENSIRYLHEVTNTNSQILPAALRSFYVTKCRLMELRRHIYLPSVLTKNSVRCQRCFLNYSDGLANYKVKTLKKSNCTKKLLAKLSKNKPLTKFQRKYLKTIKPFTDNPKTNLSQLKITCSFCNKECHITVTKPKYVQEVNLPKKNKKKKKKKDKFCGLNENVVIFSSTPKKRKLDQLTSKPETKSDNKKLTFKTNHNRGFDSADFIPLKTRKPKLKISKKEKVIEVIKSVDMKTQKKKLKSLNKLSNVLKNVNQQKKSANLQDFLKSL